MSGLINYRQDYILAIYFSVNSETAMITGISKSLSPVIKTSTASIMAVYIIIEHTCNPQLTLLISPLHHLRPFPLKLLKPFTSATSMPSRPYHIALSVCGSILNLSGIKPPFISSA